MNVALLGHVDSGKTTLARSLSTLGSTASFDKHAASSNLRANTIDLGFSTFTVDGVVIALIDCPGHASLTKAVLAVSSVFDMAIIVVNAAKGIEPQTAEHLLLVSLLCPEHVVIVINKIDLVDEKGLNRTRKQIVKALQQLNIPIDTPVVSVSLLQSKNDGISTVMEGIKKQLYTPERVSNGKFIMNVDHCFPIKGKGNVMTGTIIDGTCRLGMDIEIPFLNEKRRIKGMQRWKEDVQKAETGDRVALLVSNLPEKRLNRFAICEHGALLKINSCLVTVKIISFFKGSLSSHTKLHISIGFETVMATCQFLKEDKDQDYEVLDQLCEFVQYAILSFEQPIYAKESSFYLASKLDSQEKACRFAFHGTIVSIFNGEHVIKRFRKKHKDGRVERIESEKSVICSSMFNRDTDINAFKGMRVLLSTGEVGTIEGAFGKSGKIRVSFSEVLKDSTIEALQCNQLIKIELSMKKYLHDGSLVSVIPDKRS